MLLFSKTYTVNDSTSRAFHFFHCFEKLPCMYALLCIFSDAQDEMRWSANFLYLCIFDKNPTECTYSGNTVLKRDWIILVAALSGTTLEYICENNLFSRIYCDLMQTSWAGLTTTNGLYICLADFLRYHHIDENFAPRSMDIYGLLTRCRSHREMLFCGTYNPWYCRSYARFVRFSNKYHPTTPDFGRLPHPVCGFAGFRPDLPVQAAVCWSRTYFLSKIFLLGFNLCNFSASTKHDW